MFHLVTLDFPPSTVGGVASWAEDLARALVQAGERVRVYARGEVDQPGLPFEVVRIRGRSWARWQGVWARLAVGGSLRSGDRLLCASWPVGSWLAPKARDRGLRVGVAFHGSDLTRLAAAPAGLRQVIHAADALFPVSGYLAGELRRLGGEGRVLPMPLTWPREPALHGEGLVTLARVTPLKGVDRALRLAAALSWPIEIIGEGPELPSLRSLAQELGVNATFAGELPREEARLRLRGKAACLLLPRPDSDGRGSEGLGLALLEAMGEGTPVVGCRTGGVPEAVGPGLLLEDPDDAVASARALQAWLKPARREEAARWVRAHHGAQLAASAVLEALA